MRRTRAAAGRVAVLHGHATPVTVTPTPRELSILLADDHRLLLNAVRQTLERVGGFRVVGEALTVSQVLPLVRRTRPDVLLLDLRIAGMDGLDCLDQVKQHHPEVHVIVLSASTDEAVIENAISRGARAFIVKSVNPVDLPEVIRQAIRETIRSPFGLLAEAPSDASNPEGLTPREIAILTAVAEGLSNTAIARQLWVAPQTVKFHLTNIYRKLGVANRTQAAHRAYQQGLVAPPRGG